MSVSNSYEIIVIGGSYAGLSAAMTLGRSLRRVLIIDSGMPCNRQTPHSHNFITQDGAAPAEIAAKAREQVLNYPTISWLSGTAVKASKETDGFTVETQNGENFQAKKILFATGIVDIMPEIEGFQECWGISVLHCPYCHGYEVRNRRLGVFANGESALEFCRHLYNWSNKLTLFTNGPSQISETDLEHLRALHITINEHPIQKIRHSSGKLTEMELTDGSAVSLDALFAKVDFRQHCDLPRHLGCSYTEHDFLITDDFQRTTIPGIYAAGDCATYFRSVAAAVAAGNKAGAIINRELIGLV